MDLRSFFRRAWKFSIRHLNFFFSVLKSKRKEKYLFARKFHFIAKDLKSNNFLLEGKIKENKFASEKRSLADVYVESKIHVDHKVENLMKNQ